MRFIRKFLLQQRRWRLETLSDLWRVVIWLDAEHKAGRGELALDKYLARLTPIILTNVERYAQLMQELDKLSGGVYSTLDPARNARIGLPPGVTLMNSFEKARDDLRPLLERMARMPVEDQTREWRKLLENPDEYRVFVTRLVQQFGNFELVAMSLPGVGKVTIQPRVQQVLAEMYRINTRHIRLLDIGYSLIRAWHAEPPKPSLAFFVPEADMSRLVREMLFEYMVESDPERIAVAQERARRAGRRMQRYRFWRPAETFRQMSQVVYEQGAKRRPRPTREYVAIDVLQPPSLIVDIQRFEWAIKEVFNNCIAATTHMSVTRQGLVAQPLERQSKSPTAIRLSVKMIQKRAGLFQKPFVRLIFQDEGVGMTPEHAPNAPLWAYSTRRGGTEEKQAKGQLDQNDQQELLIGGKGIGLPFAKATMEELGGTLDFQSTAGIGTVVTIDLPLDGPMQL